MIDWTTFDAALFDLDGVLTKTARVHATCWKHMFDEFLHDHATRHDAPFVTFDIGTDYVRYVDGKPRYDGVRDFLASRDISVPEGDPDDPPDRETICGLGNRKRARFLRALESDGVEVYDGALAFLRQLRRIGLKTAVVSSSTNCQAILQAAGIVDLFDLRVDGDVARRLHLRGKPEPGTFLEAARQLGVSPSRALVVEDAVAGVEAGRAGHFGLVIGVDHHGDPEALRLAGADVVVDDLAETLLVEWVPQSDAR